MGNKTLCCSTKNETSNSIPMSKGPQSIAHVSFSGCQISLSLSRLFNEPVDAVVVIANAKLKLGANIQNTIKRYGGQTVLSEVKRVLLDEGGKLEYGQVVYTHAGDMDYDYIFYAVLPSCSDSSTLISRSSYAFDNTEFQPSNSFQDNLNFQPDGVHIYTEKLNDSVQTHERQNIYECVINCLNKASELGIQSIALPVMEPSVIHISKSKVASIMLFAIKTFLQDNDKGTLTEIRLSTQDAPTLNLFKYYLNQILNDQSETTIPQMPINKSQDNVKSTSQISDDAVKMDDIMKFCRGFKDVEHNKHKSSF